MKKVLFFAFLILNIAFVNGCSAGSGSKNNNADKSVVNTNSQINNISNESGIVVSPPITNAQNVNVSSNTPFQVNKGKTIETNTGEKPKTTFLPAAHNSSIGTEMSSTGDFLTIRIFNSDKQIQKLEKNENTEKIKVFLKNGKVMEVPADNKFDFRESSPQDILIALGLLKATPTPDSSQTGAK